MSQLPMREAARIEDTLTSGHRLCAGCAHPIVGRMIMKAASKYPTIVTNATGCLEVATTIFPYKLECTLASQRLRERRRQRKRNRSSLQGNEEKEKRTLSQI